MKEDGTPGRPPLPRSIWALGFVSLFMDISSEMIHALLPVFLVTALGASMVTVGTIEGIGEATAAISKLFSGWLSDRIGKRKLLTLVGYGVGALSKPLFAVAPTPGWVLFARFSDRIGKGVRGAPRDALIGDIAPAAAKGAAYGLRQSLDTVGAFLGPFLALALMEAFDDRFRLVFWIAVLPGLAAVAILAVGVREPTRAAPPSESRAPIRIDEFRALGRPFYLVVAIGTVLTLARFSEAFLILRATGLGLSVALAPLVLIVMNVVYAATAYPFGVLSDRMGRRALVAVGFTVLIGADAVLAAAPSLWVAMLGIALWGLHLALTQGLLSALIADTAPEAARGTAFGAFYLATGLATLAASVVAGALWSVIGPAATFAAGGAFTSVGLVGLMLLHRRGEHS